MKIQTLTKYDQPTASRIRELLVQLSRSGKDKGEIPQSWFDEIIASPHHDVLLALDDNDKIVGVAVLSTIANFHTKKAYLEDFVTDSSLRGQGIGSQLWEAMLDWAKAHNCSELDFTSGYDRASAHSFYLHKGAEIYDTAFFRKKNSKLNISK